MMDQAEKLRKIVDNLKSLQKNNKQNLIPAVEKKNAKVITVTSGKGGVGKTNIAVNLGIALSELGLKVIILDADFGLANIDVLFGMIPKHTLVDVIHSEKNILQILSEGPSNVKFISGGSGVEELIKLDNSQLEKFLSNISLMDKIADIILIDTGAGLSDNVMNFVMSADEVLLVTTPEPTSITDAYALIKMISNRDKGRLIKVIVNRAEDTNEANDLLSKLSIVSEKFLSLKLMPLGYVLHDEAVIKAVKTQNPFLISFPKSNASKQIRDISRKLICDNNDSSEAEIKGIKGFMNRLVGFLNV
ncbi:MAG TPA: MinD/ParA family protein [Pseudobacteroides sp.]|uniref:MinD/ParA family protein n=1 Tax=Pseudobacteroides sp. TaxID=1968840 RepID=UPI002F9262E3